MEYPCAKPRSYLKAHPAQAPTMSPSSATLNQMVAPYRSKNSTLFIRHCPAAVMVLIHKVLVHLVLILREVLARAPADQGLTEVEAEQVVHQIWDRLQTRALRPTGHL